MPTRRLQYNFYAVSNGREIGIFTNWTQAGESVLGFGNTKYKGYITYSEAKSTIVSAGIIEYDVFDGQTTLTKSQYEKQMGSAVNMEITSINEKESHQDAMELVEVVYKDSRGYDSIY